jgi:hypothetical protein
VGEKASVVVQLMRMTKETTLNELGEMMERGFAAIASDIAEIKTSMTTKVDIARFDTRIDDLREEMIDQFNHVDRQFEKMHDQLHEVSLGHLEK